jgi:hypothetical protein
MYVGIRANSLLLLFDFSQKGAVSTMSVNIPDIKFHTSGIPRERTE